MKTNYFKLQSLSAALALAGMLAPALAQTVVAPSAQELMLQKMEQMQQELNRLKGELAEIKATQSKTQTTAEQANATAQQTKTEVAEVAAVSGTGMKLVGPSTVLTGYGEINYNNFPNNANANATQATARRIVLGVQHRFDAKTKFVGEFEWENAVVSATDRGETAIEQAYIEHQITDKIAARGGLFLIPMGLINENHEPDAFYGVERNFVETAIIPSTWREGGLMLMGTTDAGLTWKAGISTGFDLSKWDSNSGDGKESPLRSVHQELQLARAKNLSYFGALDWRGYPGLLVGGAFFTGEAGHGALAGNASPRVTIWDIHARWTPGKWDVAGVYASGSISGAAALNVPFAGDPTPIPSQFDGAYVQVAYKLWSQGDYQLKPFMRLERFNTAKAYETLPTGLGRAADPYVNVTTVGANFHVAQNVVIKGDYQVFSANSGNNRVGLGLGWSF